MFDYSYSLIDKLGQLKQRWNNRLVLEGLSICEAYVTGRLSVICDLDI